MVLGGPPLRICPWPVIIMVTRAVSIAHTPSHSNCSSCCVCSIVISYFLHVAHTDEAMVTILMGALHRDIVILLCSEVNLSVIPRYVDHLLATGVQHVFGKSLLYS